MADNDPRAKLFNDQVHGYIKLNGLCVSLIDTPQFQRLRDLKQLGTLYYVFPGASHNRFEHSLGVGYLAGETIERFRLQQPELELTQRESNLLSAAGLLHDIGHGPFSHVFEHQFMPQVMANGGDINYHHEDMSLKMIEYMVDENNIDIEKDDLRFIQELIVGAKDHHMQKRMDPRGYLYEIVANGRNCIDVDKFDYLARDMLNLFGVRKGFNFSRLWMFNRVIDDQICYHTSVNLDIYDLFQQRYQMHKSIYNHRKGKAVEFMICDAMMLAASKNPTLTESRRIIKQLRCRQLYEFIDEYLLPPHLTSKIPRVTSENIACHNVTDGVTLNPEDIIIADGRLNYNLQDQNPVDNVSFYSSNDLNHSFHIPKYQVSLLFPEKFEERVIRVYSRNSSPDIQKAIFILPKVTGPSRVRNSAVNASLLPALQETDQDEEEAGSNFSSGFGSTNGDARTIDEIDEEERSAKRQRPSE
ncbi:Deoxynucleoside triphosphate triphosphohydrolase, partial [Globisporangium splendens]